MPNQDFWLIFKTKKEGNAPKQLAGELKEVKAGLVGAVEGMTGMSVAGLGMAGVIAGVGKGLKDALDDTMNYAEQVRDLGRISGATAEDTSRLIQTADDLKVGYDTLQQAAKALAKDGIALTTEELAKSADEYLSIEDAGGRAEYATKKFGKAGLELTKVLEQGGGAIRDMAKEQSKSLILTQKQVDSARDLEKAEDALGDAFMGVKLTVGNAVIPVLTKLMGQVDDLINGEAKLEQANIDTSDSYEDYTDKIDEQFKALQKVDPVLALLTGKKKAMTVEEWKAVKATERLTEVTADSKTEFDEFSSSMGPNAAKVAEFKDVVQALADKTLADANAATKALANDAMEDLTKAFIQQKIMATLTGDALLEYMRKEGLLNEDTYKFLTSLQKITTEFDTNKDGVIDAYEAVDAYKRKLGELNGMEATTRVNTIYTTTGNPQGLPPNGPVGQGHGSGPTPHTVPGYYTYDSHGNRTWVPAKTEWYAAGGSFVIPPGYENHTWPVGPNKWAKSGEEVIIKPKRGSGTRSAGDRPLIGTVILNNGMDLESFKRMLMEATR